MKAIDAFPQRKEDQSLPLWIFTGYLYYLNSLHYLHEHYSLVIYHIVNLSFSYISHVIYEAIWCFSSRGKEVNLCPYGYLQGFYITHILHIIYMNSILLFSITSLFIF